MFTHETCGTGFPDALHSNVTAPPLRAVICPLDGTALTDGGTEIESLKKLFKRKRLQKTRHLLLFWCLMQRHLKY